MRLIDTHTHLYAPEFDDDRDEAIQRCLDSGVDTLLLPNIDVDSIPRVLSMMDAWPEMCHGMMGLHPCHVGDNWEGDLEKILKVLDSPNKANKSNKSNKFVAVGEIGLDLYWDKTQLEHQKAAFTVQANWAKERNLPIVIHVRDAWEELFDLMDHVNNDSLTGVFHCFTGGEHEAKKALEYGGFMLGIGGVSTYKNGGLDKVLPGVGLEHLVLETDSPYLSPVPFRGKRNESSYVVHVGKRVAEILGVDFEDVARVTTENAERMFRLKKS